jgi:hypothetical protein
MNVIMFNVYHGKPSEYKQDGNTLIYMHYPSPRPAIISLQTDKTLVVGDIINYKSHLTKVEKRIYYPEQDYFIFMAQDVYDHKDMIC